MTVLSTRLVTVMVTGLIFILLQAAARFIPPLQSPDELSHVVRIASLVEGEWIPVTPPGGSTGAHFDLALVSLSRAYVPLIKEARPSVDIEAQQGPQRQTWLGQTAFGEAPGSAVYLPVVYLPAAIGLALGKALEWPIADSYHLARAFSHAFCALLLGAAFRLWRPPLIAWAILALPMAWFQMASPVIDGPAHAMTVLLLSLTFWMVTKPGPRLPQWSVWAWVVLGISVVTARLHFAPVLAIPWVLAGLTAASVIHQRRWLVIAATATVGVAAWVLWVLFTVSDLRVVRPLSTGDIIRHYLTHPDALWAVFARTFTHTDRWEFLVTSFVGNLGWLDTQLAPPAYTWLTLGLVALLCVSVGLALHRPALEPRTRLPTTLVRSALGIGAGLSVLIAFLLMLWTWSPFPTELIEGVQGRYLLGPALLLSYAVGDSGPPRRGLPWGVTGWVFSLGFTGLSAWFLWHTLLARYPEWARGSLWG